MKLIRNTLAVGFAVAAVSLAACSSNHGSTGTSGSGGGGAIGSLNGNGGHGNIGSVGMHLTIGNGVHVNSLNWTISNGTNSYSGTVNITDDAGHEAQSIEFVAGGIIAGSGYIVTLERLRQLGRSVRRQLRCGHRRGGRDQQRNGHRHLHHPDRRVDCCGRLHRQHRGRCGCRRREPGPVRACPGITALSISPSELEPPETAALTSTSTTGSGGTETILWTTSCAGAIITNPTSANATFACGSVPTPANCTVTLTVGLDGTAADGGNAGQVCTTQPFLAMNETITCEGGGAFQCFAPTPNVCTQTDGGAFCVDFTSDVNHCGNCTTVCPAGDACTNSVCAAPPLVPCTTAGQTNCVQCQGNASGLCSQTEAAIVNLDIQNVPITTAGPDPAAGCYSCLVTADCIDDTVSGDTLHECEDLPGNFTGDGGGAGQSDTSLCVETLSCVLTSGCANTTNGQSFCYCGSGGGGPSACASAGAATNGACKSQETNGLFPTANDSTDVLKDFTDTTEPSGMANQIIKCAVSNKCTQCLL